MPKTKSTELYDLLRSLSMSEKRYFKIHAKSEENADNMYFSLFDAMVDPEEVYDEEQTGYRLYGQSYLEDKNKMSALKLFLNNSVLKVLQQYDARSSIYIKLNNKLQQINVLYRRAQYKQCESLQRKALKIAKKYEQFQVVLELLQWERQLSYLQIEVKSLSKRIDVINDEIRSTLEQLENLESYRAIFYQIWISLKQDASIRTDEQLSQLNRLMDDPLLADKKRALSHHALSIYLHIHNIYAYCILDYKQFNKNGQKWVKHLESKPYLLQEDVSRYIAAINNLTLSYGLLNDYDKVKKCLKKLKSVQPVTKDDEIKIHRQYYSSYFALCIASGEFENGYDAMQQHWKELDKMGNVEQFDHSAFSSQYFYIYFGIEDYDNALVHLNRWLGQSGVGKQRRDLQIVARLIMLILHYEMGNDLLLDSLMRSTYRFFYRQSNDYEIEKSVLSFMRKSSKVNSRRELNELFRDLRKEFVELSKVPQEAVFLQHFNFIAWFDSKLHKISFAEAVRRHHSLMLEEQNN